jgi:hypothetical protein
VPSSIVLVEITSYLHTLLSYTVPRHCVWGTQSVDKGVSELSEALATDKATQGDSYGARDDRALYARASQKSQGKKRVGSGIRWESFSLSGDPVAESLSTEADVESFHRSMLSKPVKSAGLGNDSGEGAGGDSEAEEVPVKRKVRHRTSF